MTAIRLTMKIIFSAEFLLHSGNIRHKLKNLHHHDSINGGLSID